MTLQNELKPLDFFKLLHSGCFSSIKSDIFINNIKIHQIVIVEHLPITKNNENIRLVGDTLFLTSKDITLLHQTGKLSISEYNVDITIHSSWTKQLYLFD